MPFREFGAFKLRKCRVCQLHSLTCVINVLHGVMVTTELYTWKFWNTSGIGYVHINAAQEHLKQELVKAEVASNAY